MREFVVGFDPGGKNKFGWTAVEYGKEFVNEMAISGTASSAQTAIAAVKSALGADISIVAAGIDAPLFWSADSHRKADITVRQLIKQAGCQHSSGTVQHINSLRGACVVEGVMLGNLLRQEYPETLLAESHPKAFLWLSRQFESFSGENEHERDSMIAAYTAWALRSGQHDWRDLAKEEPTPFFPIPGNIHYPIPTS